MTMPYNVRIKEDHLKSLQEIGSEDSWVITQMPVKNIIADDVNENIAKSSQEVAYVFTSKFGSLCFREINGAFQLSSITGEQELDILNLFRDICQKNNVVLDGIVGF